MPLSVIAPCTAFDPGRACTQLCDVSGRKHSPSATGCRVKMLVRLFGGYDRSSTVCEAPQQRCIDLLVNVDTSQCCAWSI